MVLDAGEVAEDRVVALDFEIAFGSVQFAGINIDGGFTETGVPCEFISSVQIRRRIMGDFSQRELAYVSEPRLVVSDDFGQDLTCGFDPLRRGKG